MNSLQNLPTLRVSSVSKTYQLYAYLQLPKPANFTCTSRLQHLSILRISSVSNIQNPCPGFHSSDSLMLASSAKMRSSIYAGFREGPPTLVNIAGVNAQSCSAHVPRFPCPFRLPLRPPCPYRLPLRSFAQYPFTPLHYHAIINRKT